MKTLSAKLELTVSGYRGTREDDVDRAKTAKGKNKQTRQRRPQKEKQTMEVRKIHVKKKTREAE